MQAEVSQACRDAAGKSEDSDRRALIDSFRVKALDHVAEHVLGWLALPAGALGGSMTLPFLQQPGGWRCNLYSTSMPMVSR